MRLEMPVLTTDRLAVRPFTHEDLAAVAELLDGEGAPAAERRPWLEWTILGYEQQARLFQLPYGDRAVALREGGALVGVVGYVSAYQPFGQLGLAPAPPPGHTCELGLNWATGPRWRGRGYAAEAAGAMVDYAFAELLTARVVATTEHANRASQRVMEKLGMALHRNPRPDPPWLQVVGVRERPA